MPKSSTRVAQLLARRLDDASEKREPAPIGATAVVWAAIDWGRTVPGRPVSEQRLRELCRHLDGTGTKDADFAAALQWALKPVYGTVSLLQSDDDGYRANDLIVKHAERDLRRPIDRAVRKAILATATPEEAFAIAAVAYAQEDWELCLSMSRKAEKSTDARIRAEATCNVGLALWRQKKLRQAKATYERVIDSAHPSVMTRALINLGQVLEENGEPDQALVQYLAVVTSEHTEHASAAGIFLGHLFLKQGNREDALRIFNHTVSLGHADYVPVAMIEIGKMFAEDREQDQKASRRARTAFQRAIDTGHPEYAPEAAIHLGQLLSKENDLGALDAYNYAALSGHPRCAPGATINMAVLLMAAGRVKEAQDAFETASKSDQEDVAAHAALNLALLFEQQGEVAKARAAYRQAAAGGTPDVARQARLDLARLEGK